MISERLLPTLCLATLLIIAGCATTPFSGTSEQERPVRLVVNNSANTTHIFEIYVAKRPASMTVHYQDGTVVKSEIDQGLSNHEMGPRTVTKIDFSESVQFKGRYTLEPGQENQSSIENFPQNGALVVVVSENETEIFAWASANCDDQTLVGLGVISENTTPVVPGISASYGCR